MWNLNIRNTRCPPAIRILHRENKIHAGRVGLPPRDVELHPAAFHTAVDLDDSTDPERVYRWLDHRLARRAWPRVESRADRRNHRAENQITGIRVYYDQSNAR